MDDPGLTSKFELSNRHKYKSQDIVNSGTIACDTTE